MNVVWLSAALEGMKAIHAYIAAENPSAAYATLKKIKSTTEETFSVFPYIGRMGRVKATRELVIKGTAYVVPYRIRKDRIEILHVLHGSQAWPKQF